MKSIISNCSLILSGETVCLKVEQYPSLLFFNCSECVLLGHTIPIAPVSLLYRGDGQRCPGPSPSSSRHITSRLISRYHAVHPVIPDTTPILFRQTLSRLGRRKYFRKYFILATFIAPIKSKESVEEIQSSQLYSPLLQF